MRCLTVNLTKKCKQKKREAIKIGKERGKDREKKGINLMFCIYEILTENPPHTKALINMLILPAENPIRKQKMLCCVCVRADAAYNMKNN